MVQTFQREQSPRTKYLFIKSKSADMSAEFTIPDRHRISLFPHSGISRLPSPVAPIDIQTVHGTTVEHHSDSLAIEEPLEIRLVHGPMDSRMTQSVYVTMRTPGDDRELAAGFLFAEGIVSNQIQIAHMEECGAVAGAGGGRNIIRVELAPNRAVDLTRLERMFLATSSCGICGKASLDALEMMDRPFMDQRSPMLSATTVHEIPNRLRAAQSTFDRTGGLHAAGLFNAEGTLLNLREDVGRHNAVDKLVGVQLLGGEMPLSDRIICVSGRASFELMQKTLAAGIPILLAVGAPSSLAVDLARRFGLTLLGFVRHDRFNIYSGAERIEV